MEKRKKRKEIENWKAILAILLILFLIWYYRERILPAPPVPEIPPTMHQFYGNVYFPNGSLVGENFRVYARVNEQIEQNVSVLDGKYGYEPLFIIENIVEGEMIEFYLENSAQEIKIIEQEFRDLGLTELNLYFDVCGDGFCASSRQESCSSCSQDCGSCPTPPSGDGGGGGVGGVGGVYIPPTVTPPVPEEEEIEEEIPVEEEAEEVPKKAFNFLIVLIIITILILIAAISYIVLKRRKEKPGTKKLKRKLGKIKTFK